MYSVDGDSIPIALLHHETSLGGLTTGTMRTDDLMDAPPTDLHLPHRNADGGGQEAGRTGQEAGGGGQEAEARAQGQGGRQAGL